MDAKTGEGSAWRLATESIVVRIRWFGVLVGYILVETRTGLHNPGALRAYLALGALYALIDTITYRRGRVVFERSPVLVSAMESIFIALLCYHDRGLDSPFRWYYLLSLLCAAIRFEPWVAWWTFALHCLSLLVLTWELGLEGDALSATAMTMVILAWATWATSALVSLLKATGERLREANADLERHGAELELRVRERTDALRDAQARVLHQEKMAAFGLLAAGIAHEVGNPLTALSSLVQMLERRNPDPYTAEKLELAGRQLGRIQRTIRELVNFSRPASNLRSRVRLCEVVEEALGIAKYYHRTKERLIVTVVPDDLPVIAGLRDHLTQVVLNLLMNSIDATERGGRIWLRAEHDAPGWLSLHVEDEGRGVATGDAGRLFQPYFTTKPQGTGLGLFVSRQIVDEHGGELSYRPREEGGVIFTIRLPVAAVRGAGLPAEVEANPPEAVAMATEPLVVGSSEPGPVTESIR